MLDEPQAIIRVTLSTTTSLISEINSPGAIPREKWSE